MSHSRYFGAVYAAFLADILHDRIDKVDALHLAPGKAFAIGEASRVGNDGIAVASLESHILLDLCVAIGPAVECDDQVIGFFGVVSARECEDIASLFARYCHRLGPTSEACSSLTSTREIREWQVGFTRLV